MKTSHFLSSLRAVFLLSGLLAAIAGIALLVSCEDKQDVAPPGSLTIRFAHQANGQPLKPFLQRYSNEAGEAFTVESFQYFISNIKLRNRQDGRFFHEPESYHLISVSRDKAVFEFRIDNISPGQFDELEMGIGVDNAHNTSADRVGDLDPNGDMAWNWTQGYKFLLFEGKYYPDASSNGQAIVYHIGDNSNYKTIKFDLSKLSGLQIKQGKSSTLSLTVETDELFKTPHSFRFAELSQAMSGSNAAKIADNYAEGMIKLKSIDN